MKHGPAKIQYDCGDVHEPDAGCTEEGLEGPEEVLELDCGDAPGSARVHGDQWHRVYDGEQGDAEQSEKCQETTMHCAVNDKNNERAGKDDNSHEPSFPRLPGEVRGLVHDCIRKSASMLDGV